MSSKPRPGPDAVVTIKVTYLGLPYKAKLPLRDMVPLVLEEHLRSFLPIPANTNIMIERYSDSAAAYVMLEPSNMAVYKQLYRAAKAKSRLKFRVSALPDNDEKTMSPEVKPVPVAAIPKIESFNTNPPPPAPPAPTVPKASTKLTAAPAPAQKAEAAQASREAQAAPLATASSSKTPTPRAFDRNLLQEAGIMTQDYRNDLDHRFRKFMKTRDDLANRSSELISQPFAATPDPPKPSDSTSPVCPESAPTKATFAVCCNCCEKNIPDTHYHCSICNDGDFDLCPSCHEQENTCYSDHHWLIKRTVSNGQIINSTTETISPKLKAKSEPPTEPTKPSDDLDELVNATANVSIQEAAFSNAFPPANVCWPVSSDLRTCNQCVRELPEREFLHCTECEDFDLCQTCFARDAHGHHPRHGFTAAVPGAQLPAYIRVKLNPGRNQVHHAICDGCDANITGVRHKCLDCPDWDYCAECVQSAHFVHPSHRFVAIYEPLTSLHAAAVCPPVHAGVRCDGPLCSSSRATSAMSAYIRGIRYKCAVCHDVDFCANCEASPANEHNKTHPMLKFKTPVRNVTVTTTGEREGGQRMPTMGDRLCSKATETVPTIPTNAMNTVQTIIDVKPVDAVVPAPCPAKEPVPMSMPLLQAEIPVEPVAIPTSSFKTQEKDLHAVFLYDAVADGTVLPPDFVFQQMWVLRNEGKTTWPAGCSIKFVGGDYMGLVDSARPAGVSELVSASASTTNHQPLAPGDEWGFCTNLRTPSRPGKVISYWRLTTPDGMRFGHRLWCDVDVRATATLEPECTAPSTTPVLSAPAAKMEEANDDSQASSIMIFPKLENEATHARLVVEAQPTQTDPSVAVSETDSVKTDEDDKNDKDDKDGEWDSSVDGFMTDDEYDILDASDEEFLEQQKKSA
ncbi:hypothetical protein E4U56_000489 [Claviceps arundinis]|uniref:ZZ-type domain-containing protein n=1 Tax=Claviceps arundinis TaxID=1623583 RepID=A0A9P7SUL3_9HYPO|nr:hypothetical protein E4U56_000489 [Claviceps arundinis]